MNHFILAAILRVHGRFDSMEDARFATSGCLDAPDKIDAGSWTRYEYGPTDDDCGIGPTEIERDAALKG